MTTHDEVMSKAIFNTIKETLREEVIRLLHSGAADESTPLNLLFGVALENIADNYVRGDRKTATYRNLKRF